MLLLMVDADSPEPYLHGCGGSQDQPNMGASQTLGRKVAREKSS